MAIPQQDNTRHLPTGVSRRPVRLQDGGTRVGWAVAVVVAVRTQRTIWQSEALKMDKIQKIRAILKEEENSVVLAYAPGVLSLADKIKEVIEQEEGFMAPCCVSLSATIRELVEQDFGDDIDKEDLHAVLSEIKKVLDQEEAKAHEEIGKIAVVIDVSGSMQNVLDMFTADYELREQVYYMPNNRGGTSVDPINELALKYEKVYWFTDGMVSGEVEDNVQVILTDDSRRKPIPIKPPRPTSC